MVDSCEVMRFYAADMLPNDGSSNIISAYLGPTKLNGIYLGLQKLL